METESKEVLTRFKKYLENQGLTQKTFAEKYGLKPSYISAIFVRRRAISAGLMKAMMEQGEGPELTWILTGQENTNKKLKQELVESRMLIKSLEDIITKAMKGG